MLDDGAENQVQTPTQNNHRTIYDASSGEVFYKSLIAGFALGLGKTIASLIFYVVVFGLLATFVTPFLEQMMEPINRLIPVLEQSTAQQQSIQNQFKGVINTFGSNQAQPSPEPKTELPTE